MIETMLGIAKAAPPDTGDTIFYLDMAQAKDTVGNRTATLSGGAVIDTSFLIDGKPTLRLGNAGGSGSRLYMALNPAIDLSATNWTVEWSEYLVESPVSWTNEIYMSDPTLYKGFTCRFGDVGYGNLLMFADNNNSSSDRSECRINITRAQNVGVVARYCMTCDSSRVIRFYLNGAIVKIANGNTSGSGQFFDTWQSGPASNFANLTSLYMGALNANANNVNRYLGNLRISNYVRYRGPYTPGIV